MILLVVVITMPTLFVTNHYRRSASPSDLMEEYRGICHQTCKLLRFIELNAEVRRGLMPPHGPLDYSDSSWMTRSLHPLVNRPCARSSRSTTASFSPTTSF